MIPRWVISAQAEPHNPPYCVRLRFSPGISSSRVSRSSRPETWMPYRAWKARTTACVCAVKMPSTDPDSNLKAFEYACVTAISPRKRPSLTFSRPAVTIQTAVLDSFGDVLDTDRLHTREVGDGACHFEDAIVTPGAQAQPAHGRLQ